MFRTLAAALGLLLASTAVAQDIPDAAPRSIQPLKLEWFMVDGKTLPYQAIEGWLLTDPQARPYALRRSQMKFWGATLTTFGGSVLVVGTSIAIRNITEDDERGTAEIWVPLATGAALAAVGIPLIFVADIQGRKAARVYGAPTFTDEGAGITLGGTF